MVMSSIDIAGANGVFQQQFMTLQQNASMLGALGRPPGTGPSFGEHVMGRGTNIGTAVAGPAGALGLGMMGLDPVSLALRGGRMGFSAGGFAGAGAGALGGLAMGGGIAMAGGFAMNQMAQGIQQQQQLNSMMSQGFTFQNRFGGTGFTGGENRMIGASLAGMQGWSGPGQSGHMVGFEELSRLAANMGKMGMGTGIQDVKQFGQRFKEMLSAVKEISHTFQTSLEEAQKMMSDMRGSGVFGFKNAAQISHQVRAGAVAGGLATSEVTGMMGIGSQLARMTGGLGRQGARAGIEAITNIGAATQAGVLSEEQIYNVTGLTGAEGRRAFATRMLEQSSQFLKGTQGRYFMASVAGSGGKLNESAVQEYLSGGMVSPERTKEMANQNLAKVGRADFIRNEGRLRAAVAERFGGLETVISMQQWLGSRGISMDDDRARLYLQRARGMGRDEADAMIDMGRNLPRIMEQRQSAARQDEVARSIQEARSHVGIEGIKRKFETAREKVQKALAEPARALFQAGSEMIDEAVGRMTGEFLTVQYRHIDELTRSAKGTGAGAIGAREQLMGRLGTTKAFSGLATAAGRGAGFGGGVGAEFMERIGTADAMRDAGFDLQTTERRGRASVFRSEQDVNRQLENFRRISEGAAAGASEASGFGKSKAMQLLEYAGRKGLGKGTQTLGAYEQALTQMAASGDKEAATRLQQYKKSGDADKARMMASDMAGAGLDVSSLAAMPASAAISSLRSGSATKADFQRRLGQMALGTGGEEGVLSKVGRWLGISGSGNPLDDRARASALGAAMDSEEFLNLGMRALSRDQGTRDSTRKEMLTELAGLQGQKRAAGSAEEGRYQALGGLLMSQDLDAALKRSGVDSVDKLPAAERDRLVKQYGKFGIRDFNDLKGRAAATGGALAGMGEERRRQFADQLKESSRGERERMLRAGIMGEGGGVGAGVLQAAGGAGSTGGRYVSAMARAAQLGAAGDVEGAMAAQAEASELREGMSSDQLKSLEGALGADRVLAGGLRAERQQQQRFARGRGRGGQAGALKMVAQELGVKIDSRELLQAQRHGEKGIDAMVEQLISESGVKSESGTAGLRKEIGEYVKKGDIKGLRGALGETGSERFAQQQQKSLAEAEAANPLQAKANKFLSDIKADISEMKRIAGLQLGATEQLKPAEQAEAG
jgi:hypothetical protein